MEKHTIQLTCLGVESNGGGFFISGVVPKHLSR